MKHGFKYRWLIFIVPFLLGVYGYLLAYDYNWLGAVYSSLRLYGLNIDIPENDINLYIQIARWLAAIATTSVIMLLFQRMFSEIGLRWKLRNPEAVVVHGDGARRETVAEALGQPVVLMSGASCMEAKKHVLAFENDTAAIRYLQENEEKLLMKKDKEIYFSAFEYEPSDYAQTGLIVSNNAVNCARVYWQEHWLRDANETKIAIVGFGQYAQRILEQALLVNVIAWRAPIEYHVYGQGGDSFRNWYPQLQNVLSLEKSDEKKDSLFFHPSIESHGVEALGTMDRIILALDHPEENLLCLNKLITAGITGKVHVLCNKKMLQQLQYMPEQQKEQGQIELTAFGDSTAMYTREVIMHGRLLSIARQTHITYVRESAAANIRTNYASCTGCRKEGKCGDCPHAPGTWDDLTPFKKASNIAAADHEPIKRYMLSQAEQHGGIEAVKFALSRAEHDRWMRFCFLHNWKYGKVRNDAQRIHPSLLPFESLPPSEQEKDWWSYSCILSEQQK